MTGAAWRLVKDLGEDKQTLREWEQSLRGVDLGYKPGTTWEEVKDSPATNVIPFAMEQGLVSIPDMAAVIVALPAYVVARTGELAGERAESDLRKEATVGDLAAALPGAVASALMERLGAKGVLGIGVSFEVAVDQGRGWSGGAWRWPGGFDRGWSRGN